MMVLTELTKEIKLLTRFEKHDLRIWHASFSVIASALAESRQTFKKLVKVHTTRQQIAKRARIIELVAAGIKDQLIAQDVGVNWDTVRH